MSHKKNQHFVPKFYFRQFSKDGASICVLHRKSGRLIERASISGQASQARFYGDTSVEDALTAIEGNCSTALRELAQLSDPTHLPPDFVDILLDWMNLQSSRTVTARAASKHRNDAFLRLQLEAMLHNDMTLTDERRNELLSMLPWMEADAVSAQLMEMDIALECASSLRDLTPVFLANKTNRPYVFGDSPVVLYNSFRRHIDVRGVLGLDSVGLMVFYPLSSALCLMLLDPHCYGLKKSTGNRIEVRALPDVMALNKLQLHAASECVFFGDFQYAPYVGELWRQESHKLVKHASLVNRAPGFSVETKEPMGDITHAFRPQLPYRLSLSFLSHAEDPKTYPYTRRSRRP